MLKRIDNFHYDCVSEIDEQIKKLVLTPYLLYSITDICFEYEKTQMGRDNFWRDNDYSFFGAVIELLGEEDIIPF